jgi:hypothetical protein
MARYRQPQDDKPQAPVNARFLAEVMYWPSGYEPVLLEALGMWSAAGDSGDTDAHKVIALGIMDKMKGRGPGLFGSIGPWVEANRVVLEELRRCWRVEAARADLVGLWESIDNDAPGTLFNEQYARWSDAAAEAARAAIAAWHPPDAA